MSVNPRVVKESFGEIEPFAEKAVGYFYGRLFAENPRLRALFPAAMDGQRDRVFRALTRIVWSLDSPESLTSYLARLGRDHRRFGVVPEHYDAVGRALIATLRVYSGDAWTPEVEANWRDAFAAAAEIMIRAADEDPSPPWWIAEVVEHERRGSGDIAVLAVRPSQRLPFAAGQHVSLQVKRWPRIWRYFSPANAPRPDGVLRFHVRAVPAGWVSNSLVRDTQVGDTLLLGPSAGTMTIDPESSRALLLVAGGTGLAPLKALAEQVVTEGVRRDVQFLVGARTARDLYDTCDLRLLESTYPWLKVTPVVGEERDFDGMTGPVCDVLDRFGDLTGHDCYVAGPEAMISKTVHRLLALGVPPEQVRHDPLSADY
jgi:NAD(P)H-flavin reductase/hemoglobin-like flavoprotein